MSCTASATREVKLKTWDYGFIKHFEFQYEVRGETGDKLQSGSTVQVMYDYSAGASSLMPVDLRRILESFDGPLE